MIARRHASHSSRAGSHDATCLSACANLPASLLTGMPALRRSRGLSPVCPAYNVMIYHRPCILRIKLEAKGELRGAPTATPHLLVAIDKSPPPQAAKKKWAILGSPGAA